MSNTATLKDWINAPRPWTFTMPGMTAVLTFVYVFFLYHRQGPFAVNWLFGVISIASMALFQTTSNLLSDYYDYKLGVDREDIYGSRHLVDKVFQPKAIWNYAMISLLIGVLLGLYMVSQTGLPLLYIGLIGVIFTVFYSYFKYRAMAEIVSLIAYGPVIALGTFYAMTTTLDWTVVALTLPLTCISVTTIHANNTRDIMHDTRANIKTVALLLGVKGAILEYKAFMYATYLLVVALVLTGVVHWITLLALLTLPFAIRKCRIMDTATFDQPVNICDLDLKSCKFQFAFSVIFSGLFLISAWL
jgi:1,4-dihydroxy-2-naphthoate octaprenyltransferase